MNKKLYSGIIPFLFLILTVQTGFSQNVGVNNTNPLSTLDVTGSFGYGIRAVSLSATLNSTDATVLARPGIVLTLPSSGTSTRRIIHIVFNGSSGASAVTIKPAGTDNIISNNITYSSASGILLNSGSMTLQSDGTGKWYSTLNTGAQSGTNWLVTGNAGTTSSNFLGTTDNVGLTLRTNNTSRLHIDSLGRVSIGSYAIGAFDAANPEEFLVDAKTTSSTNLANFVGSINNYLKLNVQNKNGGTKASSDFVATADNGSDSTNFADFGINSSTYAPSVDNFGGPDDAYLYCYSRNLVIGTQATTSDIIFLTGGGSIKNNAALRIVNPGRNVVIGKGEATNSPVGNILRGPNGQTGLSNIPGGDLTLQGGSATTAATGGSVNIFGGATITGTPGSVNINASANFPTNINTGTSTQNVTIGGSSNNILFPAFPVIGGVFYTSVITGQISNTGAGTSGFILKANGAGAAPTWVSAGSLASGTSWLLLGNSGITQPAVPATYGTSTFGATENWIGNIDAKDFTIGTSNKERIRVLSTGNIGIGTAAPGATLDVNAYNVSAGNALNITANSLTTGTALNVTSSGTITSTGEVAQLTGNSATTGNILTLSGTGLTTGSAINATAGTTTGSAVSITSNGVTTGNGINLSANGLTSGTGLKISSSSTVMNGGSLINVTATGNSTANTVTGINSTITGINGTSIAAQFSASGATNNYSLIVPPGGGNVGIGTSAPVADAQLALKDGHLQSQQTTAPTSGGGGTTLIGTTGTVALANATDIAGKITITASGTAATATGTMITVTFNKAYTTAPIVIITPTSVVTSAAFATDRFFAGSTTTTFTIGDGVILPNGTYTFNYYVIETQ